jgi:ATP-dependent Clp protease ATP-binding subunit ClpA
MFERFTADAREVVVGAQVEARALGHGWIGTEHVLLGALGTPAAPGVAALGRLGVTPDSVRGAIREIVGGRETLGSDDADALRTLGIDLDAVRRQVEAAFGPGALDSPGGSKRRGRFRKRCDEGPGRVAFTRKAKRSLVEALREAQARGDHEIRVEYLLLGTLGVPEGLAVELLGRLGVSPDTARAAVLADLDKAA